MPVVDSLDLAGPGVAALCRRWKVHELAVFGSARREDFRPDSDVDVLVTFEPDPNWGLLEQTTMEGELSALLGGTFSISSGRRWTRTSRRWSSAWTDWLPPAIGSWAIRV